MLLAACFLSGCCEIPQGAYDGGYRLYVRAIKVPTQKPNGRDWDAGGLIADLLKVGAVLSGDVRLALNSLGPGVSSTVLRMIGKTAAPDLRLIVSATGSGKRDTGVGAPNSHVVGWNAPLLTVPGSAHCKDLSVKIWDIDLRDHDLVARGRFDLVQFDTGEPTEVMLDGGTVLVIELERLKESASPTNAGRSGTAFLGAMFSRTDLGEGALVVSVAPGTAAEAAGLKEGDRVTALDSVAVHGARQVVTEIRKRRPGDGVGLAIRRGSDHLVLHVTLGRAPASGPTSRPTQRR